MGTTTLKRLHYVSVQTPGIRRIGAGKGFSYRTPDGRRITDTATLRRIKSLVIPPAWSDVWICPDDRGHIQATGRDKRGRKQYRYHAQWRALRDANKFDRMLAFADALAAIRARLKHDMAGRGLPREKVLATVVALLERTLIRVGNPEYERDNRSFGLTTLHEDHVDLDGSTICFTFRGKNGKEVEGCITDRRLARVVKSCQEIPGQHLFQYRDEEGACHQVTSGDVNAYIQEIAGADFSAKDFRTWAGSVLLAAELRELGAASSKTDAKKKLAEATKRVGRRLGNTPAVCRRAYVHPALIAAYEEGSLVDDLEACRTSGKPSSATDQHHLERCVHDLVGRERCR